MFYVMLDFVFMFFFYVPVALPVFISCCAPRDSVGTVIGAVHVLMSCLRLVAFMYNRQQKWLTEERLPDLTLLRRMLRLGPQRVGDGTGRQGAATRNRRRVFWFVVRRG